MQNTKLSGQPIICQLLSFIPKELVQQSVAKFGSDKYYKTMDTYKQLTFMLYGVVSKSRSLTSLCKCLIFLEGKLCYLGIHCLPAVSTLSDANCNRKSEVFQDLYYKLLNHYWSELKSIVSLPLGGEACPRSIFRFDSTTFKLFSDIFKGVGRLPHFGSKGGGIKAQTLLAFDSLVPEYVELGAAAKNDKDFLGQLQVKKGFLYVFDKGYVNYLIFKEWCEKGVFFVTRLNENASFTVLQDSAVPFENLTDGCGVLKDQTIQLKLRGSKERLTLRLEFVTKLYVHL